jgi:hypothetical protein
LFEAALFSAEECAQFAQGDDLFVYLPALSRDQNRAVSTVDIASAHTFHDLNDLDQGEPQRLHPSRSSRTCSTSSSG